MKEIIFTNVKNRKFSSSSSNDLSSTCKRNLNLETIDEFAYWKSAYSISNDMIMKLFFNLSTNASYLLIMFLLLE